jgi:hypothetical protein
MYHFLYTDFSVTLQCEKGQDYTGLSVSKGIHRYVSLERGYMTSWGIHDVRKNARENLGLIKTAIEKKNGKKGTGGKGNGASNKVGRREGRPEDK